MTLIVPHPQLEARPWLLETHFSHPFKEGLEKIDLIQMKIGAEKFTPHWVIFEKYKGTSALHPNTPGNAFLSEEGDRKGTEGSHLTHTTSILRVTDWDWPHIKDEKMEV